MSQNPLAAIEKLDRELYHSLMANGRQLLHSPGALEYKHKLLIALAIDASKGAVGGVKALGQMALENGATREEIADTLKVVYHLCGVGSMHVAAMGLNEVID